MVKRKQTGEKINQILLFGQDDLLERSILMKQLAFTPPMGWNTWNTFYDKISDELVRSTADSMVEQGLLDAGYE